MSSQLRPPNHQITGPVNAQQRFVTRPLHSVQAHIRPAHSNFLDYVATPLRPFISCVDGKQHPDFPLNLLAFHLLTSQQLDNLARFYHQVLPRVKESTYYPRPMEAWIGAQGEENVDVDTKRRRFGCFIGLYTPAPPQPRWDPLVYHRELEHGEPFLIEGWFNLRSFLG